MVITSPVLAEGAAGERRYAFQFKGNDHLSAAALRRVARAELEAFVENQGREADLEDAVFQMEITYRGEGYAFAAVSYDRIAREDRVQVVFAVSEGPRVLIEAIEFTGRAAVPANDLKSFFLP